MASSPILGIRSSTDSLIWLWVSVLECLIYSGLFSESSLGGMREMIGFVVLFLVGAMVLI